MKKFELSKVSTAAWACIEFLQYGMCSISSVRRYVSTAAWACIEFLRVMFRKEKP